MMLAKLYWLTWLAIAIIAALLLVTGNFTAMMLVVFGFIAFGMVFMGMMNVLPVVVAHPSAKPVRADVKTTKERPPVASIARQPVRSAHI